MKTLSDYLRWLRELYENCTNKKTSNSIIRLINILNSLKAKQVFEKDSELILRRLMLAQNFIEQYPGKTKHYIDRCESEIINITAKYYGFVKKDHYTNEWTSNGLSLGMMLGVIIYTLTNDASYIAIGLPIGLAFGIIIGSAMDKKAEAEERVLDVE